MTFAVVIKDEAHRNILRNTKWWQEHHSTEKATEWMDAVYQQLAELSTMPERHGLAAEDGSYPFRLHQKLVGLGSTPRYRALFRIQSDTVEVLTLLAAEQDQWPG
ncbi:hypothetical protein EC9_54320 [Rosistilla ulvae]|uniref:Plasmid stabilization system protein n=1 Tax=Rosistilla ulvae TaxID=1930277 RepID=A0A517M8K1_9BACT|nr:hypothetical protein [Rosistilla ulvae]QDS91208.1 hypothetical protein EC9_54320 [Rosistilla ulvae]